MTEAITIIINSVNVTYDKQLEARRMAVREMQKAIPLKPIDHGKWDSKTCPACDEELSEHIGDGYYRDKVYLDCCPRCRQLLKWR
jgi:hypothetical protein